MNWLLKIRVPVQNIEWQSIEWQKVETKNVESLNIESDKRSKRAAASVLFP